MSDRMKRFFIEELINNLNLLVHKDEKKEEWVVDYLEAIYGLGTYFVGPNIKVDGVDDSMVLEEWYAKFHAGHNREKINKELQK